MCYTGGISDKSTGLYYLNARYYNPVNYIDPSGHWFFSAGVEFSASCIFTYKNTTQVTVDTKGYFTVENSRSYGVKIAWPGMSVSGFFMGGTGFIDKKRRAKSFDIGGDIEIGRFSISGGAKISSGSALAYVSAGYTPKKFSAAKGYLNIMKPQKVSSHAYVVCSNSIGRYSISKFLKTINNYKKTANVKGFFFNLYK